METIVVSVLDSVKRLVLRRAESGPLLLLALTAGCFSPRPKTVEIQAGQIHNPPAATPSIPPRLNVASFNVWGLPYWLNGASSDRFPKIARQLAELGPDVVLLQEVWTRQSLAVLSEQAKGSARTWWTASARRKGTFLGQSGLLTLSRYPIESATISYFSAARLPDTVMNKGALKITITMAPGQRVNVWNVHLQDGGTPQVSARQMAELIQWVNAAEDGQVADIVGGDFNFTPDSEAFRQFAAAIGPSAAQLAHSTPQPTWDGLDAAPGRGQTLDHIFVRLRQPASRIQAQQLRLFAADRREERLSDHMGIEALLTFNNLSDGPTLPHLAGTKHLLSPARFFVSREHDVEATVSSMDAAPVFEAPTATP